MFRADASLNMGTGHVMRCLTLAKALRARGAEGHFVCREHDGNLCEMIERHGFAITRLPLNGAVGEVEALPAHSAWLGATWQQDAQQSRTAVGSLGYKPDLLVVDHYALDERWERALRPMVDRIIVIDDLADRRHDCDVLLDQNLHDAPDSCYLGLVGPLTRLFVGPRYALLRPEFDTASARLRENGLQRVFAYFGGTDRSGQAIRLAGALAILGPTAPPTTLILGAGNPAASQVREIGAAFADLRIIETTDRMAQLMLEADLAVGACGGTAWERCAVGLPALVVVAAENQREHARILHKKGAVRNLGDAEAVDAACWAQAIQALKDDPQSLAAMSRAAAEVMFDRWDVTRLVDVVLSN